jgi:carboxypeptidase C (cathepsin A)
MSQLLQLLFGFKEVRTCSSCRNTYNVIGPGGSSQLGNFLELGPDNVTLNLSDNTYTEAARTQSWNDQYNLLIIDHPIGVGYGYARDPSEIPTNEDQVAQQFHTALLNLYQGGLKGYEQAPLFIFGESYAGHYIPAIADYLTNTKDTPLAGVGIGDGWTDPVNQLSNNGIFCYSVGLCNADERQSVEQSQLQGVALINDGEYLTALSSFDDLMDTIVNAGGGVNVYNYRVFGGYDDLEYMLAQYLNYPDTQKRYGSNIAWAPFNGDVYTALTQTDFMSSVAPHVSNLVEKLPVLLYNGQDDIIVNTPSALNWIKQLPWSRQADFNQLEFSPLYDQQQNNIGLTKQLGKLQVTIVNKAGHLAPMDQMNPSLVMLDGYIAAVLAGNFTQSANKRNVAA